MLNGMELRIVVVGAAVVVIFGAMWMGVLDGVVGVRVLLAAPVVVVEVVRGVVMEDVVAASSLKEKVVAVLDF